MVLFFKKERRLFPTCQPANLTIALTHRHWLQGVVIRKLLISSSALVFLASCSAPTPAQNSASCPLEQVADLPVTYIDDEPTIPVTIKGHQFNMMVDSGSEISFISKHTYDVLNIHYSDHVEGGYVSGYGGTADIENFSLADMDFGNVQLHEQALGIVAQHGNETNDPQPDGTIGYDILQLFDVGLDLPHNRITLYQRAQCQITQTPWIGDYAPVPFNRPQQTSPVIPITIDNQTFQLALDTGANHTIIIQHSLDLANIKPEATQAWDGHGTDISGLKINFAHARFNEVTIGAETMSDDWLTEDETPNSRLNSINDGALGRDYFMTHQVFIANSSHTVYLGLTVQPGS